MRFIYLEGGSGAAIPVPAEMITTVKHLVDVPLIVGGGIRSKEQALAAASAGADIIVTGNVTESTDATQRIAEMVKAIKSVKKTKARLQV
jgi:phosphoglycerol geranylgeranyltransferase